MRREFNEYLKSVGLTSPLLKRAEAIHDFYSRVCKEQVKDIFVSEHVTQDGSRTYESLWFFSADSAMEAHSFPSRDEFDSTPIRECVVYWRINKENYDLSTAASESRLHVHFQFDSGVQGDLKASGPNCDHLRMVFEKYMLPNVKSA